MITKNRTSDRSFGLMWTSVLVVLSLFPLLSNGAVRWWALPLAAGVGVISALRPGMLAPLNARWHRFGQQLQSITSPLILAVLYFVVITPVACLFRAFGRRPMALGFDKKAASYWSERTAQKGSPSDFTKPF